MNTNLFSEKLIDLCSKYDCASEVQPYFQDDALTLRCSKGCFRFCYRVADALQGTESTSIPLMHWRYKRSNIELRNLLLQGMVNTPLACRVQHMQANDDFVLNVEDILYMECDLAEWILDDKIARAFSSLSSSYMNAIFSTDQSVKISAEFGTLPKGSQPVILHEIIAKTGIVSDVAVDTQTRQYPIYVFQGPNTQSFSDTDFELYGLSQSECDAVRFILDVLRNPVCVPTLLNQARHLHKVVTAVCTSAKQLTYAAV